MFYLLKRHPIPVRAEFRQCLVLTFALPQEILQPLLAPGLTVDSFRGMGFVAIALVQTEALRPAFMPRFLGQDFFLSGYRIFAKYRTPSGRTLRGLRILRSDTNRRLMAVAGNLLTHYNYRLARVELLEGNSILEIEITTPRGDADLSVRAHLVGPQGCLPTGSPFSNATDARYYAGPLPFTFDHEPQSNSIIVIEGVRQAWDPRLVSVDVRRCTFFDRPPFDKTKPVLSSAFYMSNVPYLWKRGVCQQVTKTEGVQ